MKIYAPVKDANGVWCTVRFIDGVGETNNPWLIHWFVEHGYKTELYPTDDLFTENKQDEPNFDDMTPNELREWGRSNGFGNLIKNTRSKDKLIEILRGGE